MASPADASPRHPAGEVFRAGVTSLSWIPSELLQGPIRVPFDLGLTHYDSPPPERLGGADDVERLRRAGRFRFVNRVHVEVRLADGRVADVRPLEDSGGVIGRTNLLGGAVRFPAISAADLTSVTIADDGGRAVVRQTAGGRAPLPAPRRVHGRPRLVAPLVWTTLELTVHADGLVEHRVVDASDFPRHWVYDARGRLVEKVAVTDPSAWLHRMTEDDNPWRGVVAPARVSTAESELERRLSAELMGGRPRVVRLARGDVLFRQGEPGSDVALLLDGVVVVRRDGADLTEIGPGAVIGERALLEGARTSTVVAVTPVTVALADASRLPREDLEVLVEGHRLEDTGPPAV